MPDREKAIKELTDIGGWIAGRVGFEQAKNFLHTIDDAVALLKEQETEWEHLWDAPDGTYKGRCKKCGFVHIFIESHDAQFNFCPSCGRSMKRE